MRVWYPITVATQSFYLRKLIYQYLKETADNPDEEILFKLHDFGSRGVSSQESAAIGGAAHLVNFMGTDTMAALMLLRKHYDTPMAGFSIPAGEHSTFSSWGKEHEVDAYRNMLKQYAKPNALLAVVSDTWDIYNACEKIWGEELRQEVIDSGATVVIRPDSGKPVEVVEKVIKILAGKFGVTQNTKGYKVLNNVRIIQGDGVNPESIAEILAMLKNRNYSATNIAFGMGGALLQKVDRDTLKFAYKCSSATIGGKVTDVYKDPVTDSGKRSKRGRLDTVQVLGYPAQTIRLEDRHIAHRDTIMQTVFENGKILVRDNLETIRGRALTNGRMSAKMC
jgi:nicotinamide phosphoribosyltransferase